MGSPRLHPLLDRLPLRTLVLGSMALLMGLTLVPTVLAIRLEQNAAAGLDTIWRSVRGADLSYVAKATMSRARGHERDFLLALDTIPFQEARDRHAPRLQVAVSEIREHMAAIRDFDPGVDTTVSTGKVEQAVARYQEAFLRSVELRALLGDTETGLEGQLRDTARALEGLGDPGSEGPRALYLEARRAEAELILRGRDGDAARSAAAADRLVGALAAGPPTARQHRARALAARYRSLIEQYVQTTREVRRETRAYREATVAIEPLLDEIHDRFTARLAATHAETRAAHRVAVRNGLAVGGLALLIAVLLALALAGLARSSAAEQVGFAEAVAGGDFSSRLAVRGTAERRALATSLNHMAERLGQSYADLRRLNESLAETHRKLQRADRAKSEFLRTVTHELRTPVAAILGFADLLAEGPGVDPERAPMVARVRESGEHLLRLVNGMLRFTRLSSEEPNLQPVAVDVAALLAETVASHRQAAARRGIEVALDVEPRAPLRIDPQVVRDIVDQLVDNAVKFNREGGRVQVAARCAPAGEDGHAWLEIAVTDTGLGIAREDMGRLFQPFVQIDGSVTRHHGGLGLGLALASRSAEAHGGSIRAESEPGQGSRFVVRLPCESRRADT